MFSKVNERGFGYVYLIDRNGELIYHPEQKAIYSGLVQENNKKAALYEDGDYIETFMGEERAVVVKTVGYTGWKIVSVTPTKEFSMNMMQLKFFMLMVCTVTIFLILFGNIFISDRVTNPIRKLEASIKYLEEGNLDTDKIYIGGSHEIRHLGRTIRSMVNQMRKLMDEMVKEQKAKRKSELDALQSQINPHFLYNTLDSVVWMIESERYKEAISMVRALATLFRISLSKGSNIISIKDEITHAKNYLSIQQVRYKNKFTVTVDIAPEIENCSTIKLIIQPLLENAIYYGVEHMDGDGEITLRGYEKDGDI
ncbi:MAG TPA: histidine kinase [Lachnospiraceae bacterium]|nr:histidine kinase [Lachnospiraceae bacterium]